MKRHMLTATLLVLAHAAFAQEEPAPIYRQYATQQYMKQLLADHPEMVEARATIERQTFEYMRYGLPDTPTVALVFHLIGDNAASISFDDVQAQLEALNRDFNKPDFPEPETAHPAWEAEGFVEKAARPNIQFCLARQSPSGGESGGVLYVSSNVPKFPVGTSIMSSEQGGAIGWEPKNYLNVYVASLEGGMAGFAQMPGGPSNSDGVVINSDFFLRKDGLQATENPGLLIGNYNSGKTLSHLIASYLNLYELWSDSQKCADDLVDDTPVHNAPNFGKPGYRHVSTCADNPVEMTMNIMDNTDDEGQYMFTYGQVMRMHATLSDVGGTRAGLRTATTACEFVFDDTNGGGDIGEREDGAKDKTKGNSEGLRIQVFPNPAKEAFTIVVDSPCDREIIVEVYGALGNKKLEQKNDARLNGTNAINVNAANWASGLYKVSVRCGTQRSSASVLLEN